MKTDDEKYRIKSRKKYARQVWSMDGKAIIVDPIETESRGIKEEDLAKQLRETTIMTIQMALGVRFSDKDREDLAAMDMDGFQKRIREISDKQRESMKNNEFRNRTISTGELDGYLDNGYELVAFYPKGDKAIVRIHS